MAATVFIDGEAGATGMALRERLEARAGLRLLRLPEAERRDAGRRRRLMEEADVVVLCLPDDAARDAVAMIGDREVRIVDASSAHRLAPGWVYGLPELPGQEDAIRGARRVANPGCFATGAILLLRPLVDAGLLPPDWPVSVVGTGGYSAGGRRMAARRAAGEDGFVQGLVLGGLDHRHVGEIRVHSGLSSDPLFVPSVASFRSGMSVQVPLPLASLPGSPSAADLHGCLAARYAGTAVSVEPLGAAGDVAGGKMLDVAGMAGRDGAELRVAASRCGSRALLVARFDNLGKGSSGAAARNVELVLEGRR